VYYINKAPQSFQGSFYNCGKKTSQISIEPNHNRAVALSVIHISSSRLYIAEQWQLGAREIFY